MIKQAEDLTTDSDIGAQETTSDDLAKQFVHPGYTFKGRRLQPYTAGRDFLFNQVLDQNDAPFTIFLSFIFIHLQERPELIKLCWDKAAFREALLDWIESLGPLSPQDREEAMKIFEDSRGWARKSSIDVVPEPGGAQKKTKVKRRQT